MAIAEYGSGAKSRKSTFPVRGLSGRGFFRALTQESEPGLDDGFRPASARPSRPGFGPGLNQWLSRASGPAFERGFEPPLGRALDPGLGHGFDPALGRASEPPFDPLLGPAFGSVSVRVSGQGFDRASGRSLHPWFGRESSLGLEPLTDHTWCELRSQKPEVRMQIVGTLANLAALAVVSFVIGDGGAGCRESICSIRRQRGTQFSHRGDYPETT